MFAQQPAINNADGLNAAAIRFAASRERVGKGRLLFRTQQKFISPLNRLVYLKGGREIAPQLETPVTGCCFPCL